MIVWGNGFWFFLSLMKSHVPASPGMSLFSFLVLTRCLKILEEPQNEARMKIAESKGCLFHSLPFQRISQEKWQISAMI